MRGWTAGRSAREATPYERLCTLLGLGEGRVVPAGARKTVAVPLANDAEILGCIGRSIGRIADYVLIGDEAEIRAEAKRAGCDLAGACFEPATGEVEACARAARLVHDGRAQLLMKGQVQTATFTRAILDRSSGLLDPGRLVSHVTLCGIPGYHKPLVLTDAAINIDPTLEQKAEILRNALEVTCALGIGRPKVACVAPVEKVSPKIRSTVEAAELERMARESGGELFGPVEVQGPLGFDLAVSREAARIKGVSGPVAGDADVLLMPCLEAANVLYKCLTHFSGAAMASVLTGTRVPVVLTSRADSEDTKYLSLGLALRMAR
jgi:phosphate butyryltransferase